MLKRYVVLVAAVILAVSFSFPVFAADYSNYSTEELSAMRGTMASATEAERQSFRSEWQQRVRSMSVADRQRYSGKPANASGNGQGCGSGSKNHRGKRKRKGQGGGRQRK